MENKFSYIYLKSNDLAFGRVYVAESGRVWLYLGRTLKNEYVFYDFMPILFTTIGPDNFGDWYCCIRNIEVSVACENYFIDSSLKGMPCVESFFVVKSLPRIYGEYEYFDMHYDVKNWLRAAVNSGYRVPQLEVLCKTKKVSNKGVKTLEQYRNGEVCGVNDLVPGCLYYTGDDPWRKTYIYLGRQTCGNFVFVFCGNPDDTKGYTAMFFLRQWYGKTILISKSLKRVRPLWSFPSGVSRCFSDFCYSTDFRVDMTGINQAYLDRLEGRR